jgi:hypothetical protein
MPRSHTVPPPVSRCVRIPPGVARIENIELK